ncbi:MAG: diguanylate cyclase [Bacteroidota bacterium]
MTAPYDQHEWLRSFPGSVVVCGRDGIILEMNPRAVEAFKEDGGLKLIGTNLLECHREPARTLVKEMLEMQKPNYYTIEKRGIKKLIYQVPWFDKQGGYAGFVELSLPVPFEMLHFMRK